MCAACSRAHVRGGAGADRGGESSAEVRRRDGARDDNISRVQCTNGQWHIVLMGNGTMYSWVSQCKCHMSHDSTRAWLTPVVPSPTCPFVPPTRPFIPHAYHSVAPFPAVDCRKLAKCIGGPYADRHDGLFVPGGSLANLYGLLLARHRSFPDVSRTGTWGLPRMAVLCSEQAHFSVKKSAAVMGMGWEAVVGVECDEWGRMRADVLEEKMEELEKRGEGRGVEGRGEGRGVENGPEER